MSTAQETSSYWRSLDQLEGSPDFEEFLRREFPVGASEYPRGMSRRRWLQLMGASFALAGLTGCRRWDAEEMAPFAARPENRIPGKPVHYATTVELAGRPEHLLVTSYDGRPIKIEGNAEHPASLGGSSVFAQATLLELYDPDRSAVVRQRQGKESFTRSWSDFEQFAKRQLGELKPRQGAGLALLVAPSSSITLSQMLSRVQEAYPEAKLYEYASIGDASLRVGSEAIFGEPYRAHLQLDKAKVILTLDADLLHEHPAAVRYARDYVAGRNPESGSMSRLYAVESQFSLTGGAADHRWAIPSHRIGPFLDQLEVLLRKEAAPDEASTGLGTNAHVPNDGTVFINEPFNRGSESETEDSARPVPTASHLAPNPVMEKRLRVLASDLLAHRGACVIAAGPRQPANVHAQVHRLNRLLDNIGQTIHFTELPPKPSRVGSLEDLVSSMKAGEVQTLIILGGNPVYDAPSDLQFTSALKRVPQTIRLGYYEDETSRACGWHLPAAHPLECWGDAVSYDGLVSVTQPLIEPILQGRSAIQLLAQILGEPFATGERFVREALENHLGSLTEKAWRRLLHDGFLPDSQLAVIAPQEMEERAQANSENDELREASRLERFADSPADVTDTWEVVFTPGDTVYDGRFANNGWLQETPGFLTKLTWDNAALMNPESAKELGIKQGELVRLTVEKVSLEVPVYLLPGQARRSIGLALGYGRTAAGHVGGLDEEAVASVGVDANPLRSWKHREFVVGVKVEPTGTIFPLATTQDHHAIDTLGLKEIGHRVGELVREGPLAQYLEHPDFASHPAGKHHPPLLSLWEEPSYEGKAWGMSIDLNKCIGCNACMVACQAENNVPIVGKEQVIRGREMHWIRVDRYFRGDVDEPQAVTQPVACQQCENAPCEQVCPVAATVHSDEGLNDMVYNRCIGTRYCANNCPYKVRRFNYFDYNEQFSDANRQLVQLVVNPEVTVRSRGVMEKCTYCVQRIQGAKITAKNERRPLEDGEIMSACQQACPTRAIEFGDLNQPESRVAKAHADPRAYAMLSELNVKPRTKYLARIRNPHPGLVDLDPHSNHADEHAQGGI